MTDFKLIHGIYESVINHALEERLSRLEENYAVTKNQLDSEESSFTLALHLTKQIANSIAGIKGDDRKEVSKELEHLWNQVCEKFDSEC